MIAVELQLMLRRRRVWLCWLLLCALPALVAVLLAVTDIVPPPGRGGNFLSAVVANGQLFPAAALALVLPVFLPITVAVVAGDTIAGEAAAGTLRYLLVRPVGRLRLLVAKLVSVTAFVLLAVLLVAVTGYLVGVALFGFGAGRDARRRRRDHLAVRGGADPGRAGRAHAGARSATWRCACSPWARSGCSSPRSPTRRWPRRWACWRWW